MKKLIILCVGVIYSVVTMAQENKPFATACLSTQAAGEAFRGASISMEAGYNIKGLDISAQFSYYANHWGKKGFSSMQYSSYEDNINFTHTVGDKRTISNMSLRLNLAYDVLRFIHGNWRHHLRPHVGIGYSQYRESAYYRMRMTDIEGYCWNEKVDDGFEVALGIGYDFSITRNWSVGAFIEESMLVREQDIMGLRVRYSF